MATFVGNIDPQNFLGGAGTFDTVTYASAPGGVTIDVDTVGSAGFALGDTYDEINRYILTNLAGELDIFNGSALDEQVFGLAGFNQINGGGGNDLIRGGNDGNILQGGTGVDSVEGGTGDDTFLIAAGEAEAGDRIVGKGGTDTIELVSGGVGTTFDLSAVNYFTIEAINFQTDGTLIVKNNADQAITAGTAGGTGEIVQVNSWVGGDSSLSEIADDIAVYLGNDIDTVTWTEDTGDVSATTDTVSGDILVTYTNNGGTAADWTTRQVVVDSTGAMSREFLYMDDGTYIAREFDTTGGAGNEVMTTELVEDLLDADPTIDSMFSNYALDGIADGILDYSIEFQDSGLIVEKTYTAGVLTLQVTFDASIDDLAANFVVEELYYYPDGTPRASYTLFDAGETYGAVEIEYDTNGDEVLRINTSPDFSITETITTDPLTGDDTIEWAGDPSDNIITGDGDDEIFYAGEGADIYNGEGGNDTFVMSDTETDGTWAALFTYAEQVATSGGFRASAPLGGKDQSADVYNGGMGHDLIEGTSGDDALLLYDTATAINGTLTMMDARISGIEEFDMGDGDDVVNLTATTTQTDYAIDVLIDGGTGTDYLFAGAGNDTLIGGDGEDRLVGWKGDDVLTGGDGVSADGDADRFVFAADVGGGTDTITDFELGIDKIFTLGYGFSNSEFNDMVTAGALTITDDGTDSTVTLTDGVTSTDIIVQNVVGLTSGDFILLA